MIVGIAGKVAEVLDYNQQLSRLFALRESLEPFQLSNASPDRWEQEDAESFREFDYFVSCAQKYLKIEFSPLLNRIDLIIQIHTATSGVAANVLNLLLFAKEVSTSDLIDKAVLADAFEQTMMHHIKLDSNPFRQRGVGKK